MSNSNSHRGLLLVDPTFARTGRSNRKPRSLEQVIYEMGYENQDSPNYGTISAGPSSKPARKFCSVCGYFGVYACTRCGMRYCSQKCQDHHRETRCLKFAL